MVVLRTYSNIAMFNFLEYINIIYLYIFVLQDGDTSLLLACRNGKVDVVKVLLQAGADKSIQNKVRNNNYYYLYKL